MAGKSLKELEEQVDFWTSQQRVRFRELSEAREAVYRAVRGVEEADKEYVKVHRELSDFLAVEFKRQQTAKASSDEKTEEV